VTAEVDSDPIDVDLGRDTDTDPGDPVARVLPAIERVSVVVSFTIQTKASISSERLSGLSAQVLSVVNPGRVRYNLCISKEAVQARFLMIAVPHVC